jgi:hypothetical protein
MKWLGPAILLGLFLLYTAICFAAATPSQKSGKEVSRWERWKRFFLIWP